MKSIWDTDATETNFLIPGNITAGGDLPTFTYGRYRGNTSVAGLPSTGIGIAGDWGIDPFTPALVVCTVGGSPGTWIALPLHPSLNPTGAALPADVALPAGITTIIQTSPSLAVGTWLLNASYAISNTPAADGFAIWVQAHTATMTTLGAVGADRYSGGGTATPATSHTPVSWSTLLIVTVAGTIDIVCQPAQDSIARKLSTYVGVAASGYTLIRVA